MKPVRTAWVLVAALLVAAWGDACAAGRRGAGHHRHFHHGARGAVIISAPLFAARPFFPSPYYSYPAPVYYPPAPTLYIEQGAPPAYPVPPQVQPQPQSEAYWYYCEAARAYYPHVQTCPGGWQRVAPQPPPG